MTRRLRDPQRVERLTRHRCQEARDALEDARNYRLRGDRDLAATCLRMAVRSTQEAVDYSRWDFRPVEWDTRGPRRVAGLCETCDRPGVVIRDHFNDCPSCYDACEAPFCERHPANWRDSIA